jgi:hypothetical protein
MLAGCGGSQPLVGTGLDGASPAIATHADSGLSWMLPEAKGEDLLYVANHDSKRNGNGNVTVYTYRQGELVGTLTGLDNPTGLCTDRTGDIYVANMGGETIVEYAHGGTRPIKTLNDNGTPYGCAIDPTTGDLAAMNWCDGPEGSCFSQGTVLIYKKAKGTPEVLTDQYSAAMYYCTYDKAGNLFVDGMSREYELDFDELPKGSKTFTSIALTLPKHPFGPGGLQWYGKYLAVSAFDGNVVYQYSVHGNKATRVHSTPLDGVRPKFGVEGFSIEGTTLVAPIISLSVHEHPIGTIELFKYPEGGEPAESISKSVDFPAAAEVSPAE